MRDCVAQKTLAKIGKKGPMPPHRLLAKTLEKMRLSEHLAPTTQNIYYFCAFFPKPFIAHFRLCTIYPIGRITSHKGPSRPGSLDNPNRLRLLLGTFTESYGSHGTNLKTFEALFESKWDPFGTSRCNLAFHIQWRRGLVTWTDREKVRSFASQDAPDQSCVLLF